MIGVSAFDARRENRLVRGYYLKPENRRKRKTRKLIANRNKKTAGGSLPLCILLMLMPGISVAAQDVLTIPKPGDPVRKTLFNLLRPNVEKATRQKVIFQVDKLRLLHGWAFLYAIPLQPDQKPLDRKKAGLDPDSDGNGVCALFHKVDGNWKLVRDILFPTDVAWAEWPEQYHAPGQLIIDR